MNKKIEIEYNVNKSIDEISKKACDIIKNLDLNVESLIVQLPIGISYLNEEIFEEIGNIDIFTTNTMSDEENNNIIIIVNEKNIFKIAIDGPSASGKSTVARSLSNILGIKYLDTGAMYRAITYYFLSNNVNLENEETVINLLEDIIIKYSGNNIVLNNKVLIDELRTSEVTSNVSKISSYRAVREKLVNLQKEIAKNDSIILDGRDIGTVVLPDAEYKFYLDASPEVRARRRLVDSESSLNLNYEEILNGIKQRDYFDSTRENSPLKIAEDALLIDTTELSIQQVVELILKNIRGI